MSETIDILNPQKPKQVAIVASNPAVSKQQDGRLDSGGAS